MDSHVRASGLVMYPHVFVAGPNKHDNLPVSSPSRKLSQGAKRRRVAPSEMDRDGLYRSNNTWNTNESTSSSISFTLLLLPKL